MRSTLYLKQKIKKSKKEKLLILLLVAILSFPSISYSQDIIVKKNGDSIYSKIIEIGLNEISFKKTNNLEGPNYKIAKKEIYKLIFENGTSEIYEQQESKLAIEELKKAIVNLINEFGYSYENNRKYQAEFEGKYLLLSPVKNNSKNKFTVSTYYLDFTDTCVFHPLSLRFDDSYINIYVPTYIKKSNGKYVIKKGKHGFNHKFVIKVKGHNNGKKLRDALINYNNFFIDEN
ncbi:MAG: hypothetical protein L3J09_03925 [Flavobacteriaceae bacterium]|nr:hypothetical protein [Flavobacteriaceae bacterium]